MEKLKIKEILDGFKKKLDGKLRYITILMGNWKLKNF